MKNLNTPHKKMKNHVHTVNCKEFITMIEETKETVPALIMNISFNFNLNTFLLRTKNNRHKLKTK